MRNTGSNYGETEGLLRICDGGNAKIGCRRRDVEFFKLMRVPSSFALIKRSRFLTEKGDVT